MDNKTIKTYASIGDLERLGKLGYSFLFEDGVLKKIFDREGREI